MVIPKQEGHVPNFGELQAPKRDMGGVPYEKKTPREHQRKAVKDIVNALNVPGDDVRTQAHMACGTGKTMVALWVAEELKAQNTLLVEPSLALIAQNLKEWQANASGPPPEVLVICSDKTVVNPNEDEVKFDIIDIPARVTSSPEEVAQFLKSGSGRKIVISTYHSLPVLGDAMKVQGTGRFDIAIADEAHRTASKEDGAFTLFHNQEVVPSRLRLYLTATPKIYEGESEQKISMDDESIFGKVSHSLPFSKAIELELLTDYRLVVATLPNNYLEDSKKHTPLEMREAIKQLAVLKAIDKYNLSKVLSFHSTVKGAYKFAKSVQETGPKYLSNRAIQACGVDGSMPSSTRSSLLKLLAEQSKETLSLISNCRCLTEGIDVPAIDGVIFFDPKKNGVDIVQAIGRAIRKSNATEKEYGTIVVPLVVPANIESADFLYSSEFKHVAQVMRALRAHDDRFEVRIKEIIAGEGFGNVGNGKVSELVIFDVDGLTQSFVESLSVKVLKIGAGINGVPLREEVIVAAAIQHYEKTGEWPTADDSTSEIPLLPRDNWKAINMAGQTGGRNLGIGRTLAEILKPIKLQYGSKVKVVGGSLTEEGIIKAAFEQFEKTGEWPTTRDTKSKIPGLPGDNWAAISAACHKGYRNLKKGRTLAKILEPIKLLHGSKVKGGLLTVEKIGNAAIEHYEKTREWPTCRDTTSKIPHLPGDNWSVIDQAGRKGGRGLEKGLTLTEILKPIKERYGFKVRGATLIEEVIIEAAIEHFDKTGEWPTAADSESEIPLLLGETWSAINSAGQTGLRNLEKGQTLAKILKPIKELKAKG
jgi:superfamily II DNA or RNA helicase